MSMYQICEEFVSFFLNGAPTEVVAWFAAAMTLALATGVFSLVLFPVQAIARGFRRR